MAPKRKAIVYALADHAQSGIHAARYQIMEASLEGKVHPIVTIDRAIGEEPHALTAFHVRADDKFVVATGRSPLIWDIVANKPIATPFDYLLPSSTSDRYLGIEIDTRQLVLVDEDFRIAKRFDATFDRDRQCDLIWSPDQRFAICRVFRSSLEPLSDKCSEFRIDLTNGKRRDLKPGFQRDHFVFSSNGGEVVRVGVIGVEPDNFGDGSYGSYLELIPDGNGDSHEIYRFTDPGKEPSITWHMERYPEVLCDSECQLFAIALPRQPNETPGFNYYFIDRSRHKWRFPNSDSSAFIAPYYPVAFIDGNKAIVAHDETRLFSVPLAAIKAAAEEVAK
jgi:hypothetical protein